MRRIVIVAVAMCVVMLGWTLNSGSQPPPPEPGTVLPPFAREPLKLTAEQQKKVGVLEKEAKAKLAKILTEAQWKQLQDGFREGPSKDKRPDGPGGEKGPPKEKGKRPDGRGGEKEPPGLVIPPFIQLKLTKEQEKQVAELDRAVMAGLKQIFTEAQWQQFQELLRRGPQGRGPGTQPPDKGGSKGPPPDGERESRRSDGQPGIQWYATLESGLAEAKRSSRPILLVSAAPHCAGVSGIW